MLEFLRACPEVWVEAQWKCRQFLSAVLWMTRSGAQWRLLPPAYGNWNSVYKGFARRSEKNVFESFFAFCTQDPELESLMMDSTVVRAPACAAGTKKNMVTLRTQERRLREQAASERGGAGTRRAFSPHRRAVQRHWTRPSVNPRPFVRLCDRRSRL